MSKTESDILKLLAVVARLDRPLIGGISKYIGSVDQTFGMLLNSSPRDIQSAAQNLEKLMLLLPADEAQLKKDTVARTKSLSGENVLPMLNPYNTDILSHSDLTSATSRPARRPHSHA